MQQIDMFDSPPQTLTVSEVTRLVRAAIENQPELQNVWVSGEVSNFSQPKSGHWYFTLKDASAELRCVMWRSMAEMQAHRPQDGEALDVHGGLNVYEARGQYQLYADEVRPAGEGALYQEFLRLKARLEEEGLFDPQRKRPLPDWPRSIGLITSPTGAAIRDMLDTLARRFPLAEVVLAPAAVQGPGAARELVAALQHLNEVVEPDVILLARGGGSLEDLAAFNDEALARAIVASDAPVVSGVGHETDFSIADFVADLRAPTPTAAAELATPDRLELLGVLSEMSLALGRNMLAALRERRWSFQNLQQRLLRRSPEARLAGDRQQVDDLSRRAERALAGQGRHLRTRLAGLDAKLRALNPSGVLARGYAVVSGPDGVVRTVKAVDGGDEIRVRVSDGDFEAEVKQ